MKVGVLCEYSGTVRDAFRRRGHDAISCDLLPTERPGPHIEGDCLAQDWRGFDLLICHPPCTYLSYAGTAHWNAPGRAEKRAEAMAFFLACCALPCPRVCVENPFGLPCVEFRPPDQIIHPYYFGDPAHKRTCLWLRGLPALEHWEQTGLFGQPRTHVAPPPPAFIDRGGKARHFVDSMGRHPDRWKIRSKTFAGIAESMAEQWGALEAAAEAAA